MPPAHLLRLVLLLSVVAVLTALSMVAAVSQGRAVPWHAASLVLEVGAMASLGLVAWQHRRPWHLEQAPEAVSLENLHIVPRYYLERLASAGIFTVTSLRRADATWLAQAIGAAPDVVMRWQARAELHLLDLRETITGWSPDGDRWEALPSVPGPFGHGGHRDDQ